MTFSTTTIGNLPDEPTPLSGAERVPMDDLVAGATRDASAQDIANLAPPTNLSYDQATRLLSSSTGADAILPLATDALDGLQSAAHRALVAALIAAGVTAVDGTVTIPHIHGDLAGSLYIHVKNTSAATISKGAPVRVVGQVGNTTTLEIVAADSASSATLPAVGLLSSTLAPNDTGHAVVAGELLGLATDGYTVGQILYVAAGGGVTPIRPTSGVIQQIAIVGRISANTGGVTVTVGSLQSPAWDTAVQPATLTAGLALKVDLTDPRLTDAREWSAETMSQAEAEAGTSTTRRATTALRLRQAAAAWWQAASGAVGKTLAQATTQAEGRTALGLGSLATQSGSFSGTSSGTNTGDVTLAASVADVLSVSGQELQADDPGGDRILFWDYSESKLRHLSLAPGITIVGTTLTGEYVLGLACSDETSNLTTGTAKVTFRMPFPADLIGVRANVTEAPIGSALVVDINEGGVSVLSTKLSIDATEETSVTAATPAVISDAALADDAKVTVDIDQIGSTTAGKGLKVWLYLRRTG